MTAQLALAFPAELHRNAPPVARTTDPGTSWAAGREQTESGRRDAHAALILECLRANGSDLTYRELHCALGGKILEAVEVQRRCNDLAPLDPDTKAPLPWQPALRGPDRKCRVSGRSAQTWWAREHVESFLAAGGTLPPGEVDVQRTIRAEESECPSR